jgi:hypothetical protein
VRIAVVVRTDDRCPSPSLGNREAWVKLIRDEGWGAFGEDEVMIEAPDYVKAKVAVVLRSATATVATVARDATERLYKLFDPVAGGPKGRGWPFGRRAWRSDVFRALRDVPDIGRVEDASVLPADENRPLEDLGPLSVICADKSAIDVQVRPLDEGED